MINEHTEEAVHPGTDPGVLLFDLNRLTEGGRKMDRVTGAENTIEVFENDIDFYLHQFQEERNIDDLRSVPQSEWNACLMYIQRHVFTDKSVLKERENVYSANTVIPTNCNSYNYNIVNKILDYYIYLCNTYNKEISIMGFSKLTGIDIDTIILWGNDGNRLSSLSLGIYKKLKQEREESLSNKLVDGKQNPVGVIAILNRHYGWASPYTADSNRQKQSLTASELPKLSDNYRQNQQQIDGNVVNELYEKNVQLKT